MPNITGTSTPSDASASPYTIALDAPDLNYIVILLMVMVGLLAVDLVRRLFIRK